MPKTNTLELAKDSARQGGIDIVAYRGREVRLGVHQVNVFLGEEESLNVIVAFIKQGRIVWGSQFAYELVELLEYYKEKGE